MISKVAYRCTRVPEGTNIFLLKNFSARPVGLRKASETRVQRFATSHQSIKQFRSLVWGYWRENGRHTLPWRKTRDPYKILVSEVMLQQTQVPRVLPKYKEFIRMFPTVHTLAKAQLSDVLRVWNGLGYNRRAKFLQDAAKEIVAKYDGRLPKDAAILQTLPGVGEYTAKAVCVFAFDQSHALVETNIRTAIIHHFYIGRSYVSDAEVLGIVKRIAQRQDSRKLHSALMDYGAHLKASGVRLNARSKHYTKQSKFEGSLRQVRGAILKAITRGSSMDEVQKQYQKQFVSAFSSLQKEGLIT